MLLIVAILLSRFNEGFYIIRVQWLAVVFILLAVFMLIHPIQF